MTVDREMIQNIVKDVLTNLDGVIREENSIQSPNQVPVAISNRHVHLSEKDLEILFGTSYKLCELKPLSQPGQYACKETITIAGPKGAIEKVRVLGPVRKQTQVEISRTDSFQLGVKPPTRDSGSLSDSSPVTIIGPKGSVYLAEGCIIAQRHIHFDTYHAEKMGIKNKQLVKVAFKGNRGMILDNVLCRVSPDFSLEMHVDTDEGNAANANNGDQVEVLI